MTAALAIEAADATHRFPGGDGVAGLDLDIPAGTIFGFIGPSGAGKTTTVRLLTGALRPEEGTVRVLGDDPVGFGPRQRRRLGYMPQLSVLYPDLSVEENLRFFASIYGMGRGRRARMDRMLDLVDLSDDRGKRASALSGGMRRRLSLAAALVHDPEVLFLDEPTAGVDPMLRVKLWDLFRDLIGQGRTAFVTTQYVGEAAYCDKVGLLADGRLVAVDTPEGLRRAAFGGDLVDIELATVPDAGALEAMGSLGGVRRIERRSATSLRLVVDDAAGRLPDVLAWSADRGLAVESADQVVPPFDDVFVDLVERHREEG
jgi:ABC-2 type transport system ATP-binding protein